jgi:hypothetical protein
MPIRYTTGLGGSAIATPPYRYTEDRELTLEANARTLLVDSTDKPVNREIVILCDRQMSVFWGDNSQLIETIYPNFPHVNHDGGMKLYGMSSAPTTVRILVRSDQPIEFGDDELSIPLKVTLHFPTGLGYQEPNTSLDWDTESTTLLQNLNQLFNSDDNSDGWKMFDVVSFFPLRDYRFTVVVDNPNGNIDPNGAIQLQLLHPLKVARVFAEVAADVINPEQQNLPSSFVGRLTADSFAGSCSGSGGSLTTQFNYSRHIGRFVAVSKVTTLYDTAIIKEYIPHSDPTQPGTFVLTGGF